MGAEATFTITPTLRRGELRFALTVAPIIPQSIAHDFNTPEIQLPRIYVYLNLKHVTPSVRELVTGVFNQMKAVLSWTSDPKASLSENEPWTLTTTELSVASMRFLGDSTEEISVSRDSSVRTIEKHFENLRTKIGAATLTARVLLVLHMCWLCSKTYTHHAKT